MRPILFAALSLAALGCAPKLVTPLDEISKLQSIDDLMHNQSTAADPLWSKIGQGKFSDAELAQMAEAGKRIELTSLKVKEFAPKLGKGQPAEFEAAAMKLNEAAKQLATAAAAKDNAGSDTALGQMRAACKACHSKFR